MKRILLTLGFVCFVMPVLLSADTPEPPKANPKSSDPAPVTLESLKARRAQMTELMRQYGEVAKQYAADVAELKRQAKELNIELDIKPVDLGIGKQGPRGYSAYEVAKQNGFKGTQAEWLASLKGERGPQGPPGPPGPGPNPPPEPPPNPPTPSVAKLWIVVLEETADRNAAVGRVLGDLSFWTSLKTLGHSYQFYDQNNPGTVAQSYVTRLGEINAARSKAMPPKEPLKLPVVFFIDPSKPVESNVLECIPLPSTTAEIRNEVKTLTGK